MQQFFASIRGERLMAATRLGARDQGRARKLCLAAAAAIALVAFPATAGAAAPDLTSGTGITKLEFPFGNVSQKVHVNAQSYDGADPRGNFFVDQEVTFDPRFTFRIRGDVTCHRVDGNRAVVAGRLDEPFVLPFGTFQGLLIFVEDNGEPGAGQDRVDIVPTPSAPPPGACSTQPPTNVITDGNLVVKDR
jgi:hypothetical protein